MQLQSPAIRGVKVLIVRRYFQAPRAIPDFILQRSITFEVLFRTNKLSETSRLWENKFGLLVREGFQEPEGCPLAFFLI